MKVRATAIRIEQTLINTLVGIPKIKFSVCAYVPELDEWLVHINTEVISTNSIIPESVKTFAHVLQSKPNLSIETSYWY